MFNSFVDKNFNFFVSEIVLMVVFILLYNFATLMLYSFRKQIAKRQTYKTLLDKILIKYTKFNFKLFLLINLILVFLSVSSIFLIVYKKPKVISSTPSQNSTWQELNSPIQVNFSRPINTKKLDIYIAPEVKGEWKPVKPFSWLPFVTAMKFYPEETILPGEDGIIYVVGYNPKTIGETMIEFKTPTDPTFKSSNLHDNTEGFPPDGNIEISINGQLGDYYNWEAEISPNLDLNISEDRAQNKIIISPSTRLKLDTSYNIKLYFSKVTYNPQDNSILSKTERVLLHEDNFKTDKVYFVTSISPEGTMVMPTTPISIKFAYKLDKKEVENKFGIEPATTGKFSWTDEQSLVFTPDQPLSKGTKYKVTLAKGLKYNNIETKDDFSFDFETIGYVKVRKFNISNNAQYVSVKSSISMEFDQQVDKASAEGAFSISPSTSGTYSWSGNTLTFKPKSSLAYSKSYSITVKAGIKSINGLDSKDEFKLGFKTEADMYLNTSVPYYRQARRFECELLALRMILAYRGVYMSANQIMNEIGVSSVSYNSATNTWGDPNVYFIGDVTGESKGYGVHLDPLARVARAHGRSAVVHKGWNASALAQEVRKGNPIIILWQNGWSTPNDISWNTPEGKRIHAINGTHAGVVVGFKGSASSPTSIIVQDPWYRGGSRRTYSISSFNSLWNYHGRSALVVY